MAEERKHQTGMTIVSYDTEDAAEGEVIWDGEAESLGLPHAKTMPRVTSVDPAPPDDDADAADAGAAKPPEDAA
jgi:hypothetical protein